MDVETFDSLEYHFRLSNTQVDAVHKRIQRPQLWAVTNTLNAQGTGELSITWRIPENPKAVILVAQGRAQYAPEWIEFSDHMVDEGYAFVTYDPQGQGLSYSLNRDRRHHIENYMMSEVGDFAVVTDIIRHDARLKDLPRAVVGHSKGGNTALRYILTTRSAKADFQAIALISPMTGIIVKPYLRPFQRILPPYYCSTYRAQKYAYGQGDLTLDRYLAHMPKLSTDPVSQAIQYSLFQQEPETICHGPTWGFVSEAFKSCRYLARPGIIETIDTPTFWILGEKEQINNNQSMIALHNRMTNSDLKIYEGAQHQVHMEVPETKDEMYRDLKRFIKNTLSL